MPQRCHGIELRGTHSGPHSRGEGHGRQASEATAATVKVGFLRKAAQRITHFVGKAVQPSESPHGSCVLLD